MQAPLSLLSAVQPVAADLWSGPRAATRPGAMRRFLQLSLAGVFALLLAAQVAQAATYTVGPGTDCDFSTLLAAGMLTDDDPATLDILRVSKNYTGGSWNLNGQNLIIEGGYTSCSSTARSGSTTVYSSAADSVVEISSGSATRYTITFRYMTLRGGQPDGDFGGGIEARGNLDIVLEESLVFDNESQRGGGIYLDSGASLVLDEGTAVIGNRGTDGAGIWCDGGGTVQQLDGAIANNVATGDGGGIKVFDCNVYLASGGILQGVYLNDAQRGGGLFCGWSCGVLDGASISSNEAEKGAGIYLDGGGLRLEGGTVISSNIATGDGGGIHSAGGSIGMFDTTVRNNEGFRGGGLFHSGNGALLRRSTFFDNTASALGGGIYNEITTLSILNSTVSANTAALGPGLFDVATVTRVTNTTFADNQLDDGTPASVEVVSGRIEMAHVILVGECVIDDDVEWVSLGGSAADSGTCSLTHPIDYPYLTQQQIGLEPLAENGGFTRTHALSPNSLLIDAGLYTNCQSTDQRGVARTNNCDPGAYEAETPLFADDFESGDFGAWGGYAGP